MSPLNEITFEMRVAEHDFLDDDGKVERIVFADGNDPERRVTVTTNSGDAQFGSGEALLPPYGFLIESGELVAFHALSYGGLEYDTPALFCVRSLGGRPIGSPGSRVHIYHGFGDSRLRLPATARRATIAGATVQTADGAVELDVARQAEVRFE